MSKQPVGADLVYRLFIHKTQKTHFVKICGFYFTKMNFKLSPKLLIVTVTGHSLYSADVLSPLRC